MNGFRARLMAIAARHSRCREDAEDAFARTVELALRSCPIVGEMGQVEAWATVVCRREAWKIERRHRRKPVTSLNALEAAGVGPRPMWWEPALAQLSDRSPEERALDAEARREIQAVVERLPDGQRSVIERYACGWTTQEIAEALGRSHRSVRKALWRGRRTLRARLAA